MQMILLLTASAMHHIGGYKTTIYWLYSQKWWRLRKSLKIVGKLFQVLPSISAAYSSPS